jgi:hypothetical protein
MSYRAVKHVSADDGHVRGELVVVAVMTVTRK